jgi:predicted amidophosphoribosyltransferase
VTQFQPRQLLGKWKQGYALDLHTLSSVPLGHNEFGHMQFDTRRSEVGELLFMLKYRTDESVVEKLVATAQEFVERWNPPIDIIVPVPPSTARVMQPLMLLAEGLSKQLKIPLVECVKKTRESPQLKNIYDLDERLKALEGAHVVDSETAKQKRILLFDDLYRSGATMNAITGLLYEQGKVADVYALAVTCTRRNQ